MLAVFGSLASARFLGTPRLAYNPQFHPFGHLAQRSLQHVGNLPKPAHRWVDDPSLYAADVRTIEAALATQTFLRMPRPFTEFAHHGPDGSCLQIGRLDLPLAPLHGQIRWW